MLDKKSIVLMCSFLTIFNITNAQITNNLSLETWNNQGSYEEPANGWTTLNALKNLTSFAPVTVTKTTDVQSGTYAAKLTSGQIQGFGTFIGGLLATGVFDNNASPGNNIKLGQPYTSSPSYFKGYYKYTSVNNDSAAIFFALTKWNTTLNKRDTLGVTSYTEYSSISSYTPFNLKVIYTDSITAPDTVIMLFSSSAGAADFQGEVGSTLYIDEITLPNTVGVDEVFFNEIELSMFPNPTSEKLTIQSLNIDSPLKGKVYNSEGKLIETFAFTSSFTINTSSYNQGLYYLSIEDKKGLIGSERFTVKR